MIPGMTWQERMVQEAKEQKMSLAKLARLAEVDYGRVRGFAQGRAAHPRDDNHGNSQCRLTAPRGVNNLHIVTH